MIHFFIIKNNYIMEKSTDFKNVMQFYLGNEP